MGLCFSARRLAVPEASCLGLSLGLRAVMLCSAVMKLLPPSWTLSLESGVRVPVLTCKALIRSGLLIPS